MKTTKLAIALLTIGLLGMSGTCDAQKNDFGKREYDSKCAVCHGKLGKGDGPYAGMGETRISDLTVLARNNKTVFPFQRVYEVIDGRQTIKAHGTSEMPIWGAEYLSRVGESHFDVPYDYESFVRTRVLALTEYVNRLQVK